MHFLLGLTPTDVANIISVDQYMSFVMAMVLAFGIAFEVPLLIIMLNLAGILTHERFRKWRRVMIFGVFLVAGMANPSPDPLTMLILGGACVVLVEVAELIVWSHDRRHARLHPDPYAGLADDELSPLELPDDAETHSASTDGRPSSPSSLESMTTPAERYAASRERQSDPELAPSAGCTTSTSTSSRSPPAAP